MQDIVLDTAGAAIVSLYGWHYMRGTNGGWLRRFIRAHPQVFGARYAAGRRASHWRRLSPELKKKRSGHLWPLPFSEIHLGELVLGKEGAAGLGRSPSSEIHLGGNQ